MQSIRNYPITILAVDIKGNIKACISLQDSPSSLNDFSNLVKSKTKKRCGVKIVDQDKDITEADVRRKIQDSVEALKYAKIHELKPGINIPKEDK